MSLVARRADPDPVLALAALAVAVTAAYALWTGDAVRPPERDAPPLAEVAHAVSDVKRRQAGELMWQEAERGAALRAGDALFVAPGGSAQVAFLDGTRLDLEGNTLIALEAPTQVGPGRLRLDRGEGMLTSGERGLQVDAAFGKATLGAKTTARLAGGEDGAVVEVLEGEAELSDGTKLGARESVSGHSGAWVRNAAWTVALLSPAPGQRHYFQGDTPKEVTLLWHPPPSPGARLHIWRGTARDAPVMQRDAGDGEATLTLPGGGSYLWRIVDEEGVPLSEGRRLHLVKDAPPVPVSPLQAEVIHGYLGRKVPLGWSGVQGVRRYQVEVAPEPDFARPVLRSEVEGTVLHLGALPEGRYHWRVRALAPQERGDSPWSSTGAFRFLTRPVPDAPELLDAQLELGGEPSP